MESRLADLQLHRPGSPQPKSAQAAIEAASHNTADLLANDSSAYALCAEQQGRVREMVLEVNDAAAAGVPHGTLQSNKWGFAWAVKFGEHTGTRWMRPRDVSTYQERLREQYYVAMLLMWLAQMMSPSARRKKEGYGKAKPTSSMLAVYAFARVLKACGRYVPEFRFVRAVLKGICARYKLIWGQDALVPSRKKPFTQGQLRALIAFLQAMRMVGWTDCMHLVFTVLVCFCLSTGTRKDEWVLSFETDTYLRRANFCWVDERGNDLPPTREVLMSRKNGCLLRGRSAPAKCDRLNVEWGAKDQWFRFNDQDPLNFAWRWYQWEVAFPCEAHDRSSWPAFSPTGDRVPFKGRQADSLLVALLTTCLSAAEAAVLSWHAFRVTIAMALLAQRNKGIVRDEVEGVIQTLVRWKTVEALRIYARMRPSDYADYVDMATQGDANLGDAAEVPEIEPEDVIAEHEATIQALDEIEQQDKAAENARSRVSGSSASPSKRRTTAADTSSGGASRTPRKVFDLGDGKTAVDLGPDTWNVRGRTILVPNGFWGPEYDDGNTSACLVVGFIGGFHFPHAYSPYTYIIQCEGHEYAIKHSTVLDGIQNSTVKRQLRRQRPPQPAS